MNGLHRFGSWLIAFSLALGVAGCPKDDKKSDDKSSSADKKSDDKSDKKKKEDNKGDDDDDKSAKKDDNGGKKKKINKKDTGENDKKSAKKADADDTTAKKPPSDKKHTALADSLPTSIEKHAVPKHWGTVYDDVRMFAFQVPDDSEIKQDESTCDISSDGKCEFIEVFPPDGNDFEIDFLSFKDASLSQDDLVDDAQSWMEADDKATNVKLDAPIQINKRSKLVHYTFTDGDGKKQKGDLLVFTDVTDNYFLFVESDVDKYDANSDTMDAIWQSFTIYGRDYE